jgi:PAS domain-containing protein
VSAYDVALELTALLAFWLCLSVWQRDRATRGRRIFLGLAGGCALWAGGILGYNQGLLSLDQTDRLTFLGVAIIPALWLALAVHGVRPTPRRRDAWLPVALMAPSLGCWVLLWLPRLAPLFTVNGADDSPLPGPLFWANALYAWLLCGVGSAVFTATALRPGSRGGGAWRRVAIGLAGLVPLGANVVWVLSGMRGNDPTPVPLGLALVALRGAIFPGGLLQALPISHHDLVGSLPVPALVVDRRATVIEANPPALARLGLGSADALWRSLDAVVASAREPVEIEVWPIVAGGREAAQLVLLDPLRKGHPGRSPAQ